MKSIKRIIGVAVVLAVVAAAALTSGMVQKTPEAVQKTVLGKVYGNNITVADIEPGMQQVYAILSQQAQGNLMDNPEAKKIIVQQRQNQVNDKIIQAIVNKQIVAQKINVTQAQVDAAYNQELDPLIKKYGQAEGQKSFDETLQSQGLTEATYKESLKKELEVQDLINNMTKGIKITDADAQNYYNENKASQYTKQPGADVYDIVVSSQAEADKLLAEYKSQTAGMTNVDDKLKVFSALASANNIDSSKSTGGLLGYVPYDSTSYQAPFMDAVKGLKNNGDVSGVVENKGPNGSVYNIAFVNGINTKPTVEPFDSVKTKIIQTLTQNAQNEAVTSQMDTWKKEAGAEIYTSRLDYPIPPAPKAATPQASGSQTGAQQPASN